MLTKTLPMALLAGAVSAACPLSVSMAGAEKHTVNVAVTNTGSETVQVFKGNTVFSDHATQDLLVDGASGNALPFEGMFVNYKKTDLSADDFQKIAAGETVTVSVNAARGYQLQGVQHAKVSAIQGFRYAVGDAAPSALKGLSSCTDIRTESIDITPDQNTAAKDHISYNLPKPITSRIKKRDITYSGCTSDETSTLQTSVADAISMATAAYTAAGDAAYYFTTWFISTDNEAAVQAVYAKVEDVQTASPQISCTDTYYACTDGRALLYAVPTKNVIVPCKDNGFWAFPELAPECEGDDEDKAGSILHEMTHIVGGTGDYAYGPLAAQALSATQAVENADTYEMYAESVRLGGVHDWLRGGDESRAGY